MKVKIISEFPLQFFKLNYNCPSDEKIGHGPGSCGASKEDNKSDVVKQVDALYSKRLELKLDLKSAAKNKLSEAEKDAIRNKIGDVDDQMKALRSVSKEADDHVKSIKRALRTDKASKRIVNELPNKSMKLSAEEEFQKSEKNYKLNLTNKQEQMLEWWGDAQSAANEYLRTGKNVIGKEYAKHISDIMNKNVSPVDARVYKAVTDIAYLPKNINKVDEIVSINGFISTSLDKNWAQGFLPEQKNKGVLLIIDVPKGTHSMYMHENEDMGAVEKELVLDKNLKYKVQKIDGNEIHLSVLKSKESQERL